MRRLRGPRRRRFGPKRETDWIVSAQGLVNDPLWDTGTNNLLSLINSQDLDDHNDQFTVVRIVGEIAMWSAETSRVDANAPPIARGYWGIYKAEADSAGATIELLADDGVDADSEAWMWRNHWIEPSSFQSFSPDTANAITSTGWDWYHSMHIDLRVMRKMGGREHLVFASRIFSNQASVQIQASFQLRTLVKLT